MALLNASMMLEIAKQRLQVAALPAGVDKNKLLNYLPGITRSICDAIARWQAAATLTGVTINAAIATGGKLSGPPLEGLIKTGAPVGMDMYTNPIAAGLHNQMRSFENQVKVPGLAWYPAFVAFPAPVAPPAPNTPHPLMTIAAAASSAFKADQVNAAIVQKLANPRPAGGEALARAVAEGFEKAAFMWLGSTMVTMVMGSGPIPSFAPPYVPVGPVVNGTGNMIPGGLR